MTRATVLALLLSAAPASAQSLMQTFAIPAEYTEPFEFVSVQDIDADGIPDTREYLLTVVRPGESYPEWTGAVLVAAIRNGRICRGAWFHPIGVNMINPATAVLTVTNGRHHFRINYLSNLGGQLHTVVEDRALDIPSCLAVQNRP